MDKKKIKSWLKENWIFIWIACSIIAALIFVVWGVSSQEFKDWSKKPIQNLNVADILAIILIYAIVNQGYKSKRKP